MSNKNNIPSKSSFKRLLPYLKPYRFLITLRLISTTFKAINDILLVYFIQLLVESADTGNSKQLSEFIYLMLLFVVIGIVVNFLESYSSACFSSYAARDIKKELVSHILKLPMSYIEKNHSGGIVSRLTNDIGSIEAFLNNDFIDLAFHLIRFSICFLYMLVLDWRLLLFSLIVIPIAVIITSIINKPLDKYAGKLQQNLAKVNSIVQDSIGGIHILKAFNLKKVLYQKYNKAVDETLKQSLSIEKRNSLIISVTVVIKMMPFVLSFFFGGYLVCVNKLTVAKLVGFVQMLNYLVQGASFIPLKISSYKVNMGVTDHLFELVDYATERTTGEEFKVNTDAIAIQFEKVSFNYDEKLQVLNDLSFEIPYGKKIAIIGPSGGGKTTVFKILCGFYETENCDIKIYGKNINEWKLSSLRSLISVVSQESYLFPGSIAENIGYGSLKASMEEIIIAAKSANAHEFIMELPNGYNTHVGERGARLSGGQKQRISIARATLKNSPILLLDEPTSALDTQSEALVQEAFNKIFQDKTVLIIAHRLSTIKESDEVLVLDEGNIVEKGSHEQLLQKDGLYKRLYNKQFTSYNLDKSSIKAKEI